MTEWWKWLNSGSLHVQAISTRNVLPNVVLTELPLSSQNLVYGQNKSDWNCPRLRCRIIAAIHVWTVERFVYPVYQQQIFSEIAFLCQMIQQNQLFSWPQFTCTITFSLDCFQVSSMTEANGVSTHSTNKVNGHTVVMENLTEWLVS